MPRPYRRPRSDEDRFFAFVQHEGECWAWQGNLGWQGYGQFWFEGKTVRAHRWAYERWIGPIPDGLVIDHLCRTRSCVNPAHLEPVTQQENLLRGDTFQAANAAKSSCSRGHEYTDKNTYLLKGGRHCRTCHRDRERIRRAKRQVSRAIVGG